MGILFPPADRFTPIPVADRKGYPTAIELDGAQHRIDRVLASWRSREPGFVAGGVLWIIGLQDGRTITLYSDAPRGHWYVKR